MASQEMGLVPPHRLDGGMTSQMLFQDEAIRFSCAAPASAAVGTGAAAVVPQRRIGDPPGPRTRELSGFMDEKLFSVDRDSYFPNPQVPGFRRSVFPAAGADGRSQNWPNSTPAPSGGGGNGTEEDEDDDDEEEDEDDEVDEGDGEVEALVAVSNANHDKNDNNTNSSSSIHSCAAEKMSSGNAKQHSPFGTDRDMLAKDDSFIQNVNNSSRASPSGNHQQGRLSSYPNAITIAEPEGDLYYSQFLHAPEGSAPGPKEGVLENGCSFSGRKDTAFEGEAGDSLRAILSDPITGSLMDDAMILPCGHSFGSTGLQQVLKKRNCISCSQFFSEDSVVPNLSLRVAIQAFRREEELLIHRASKRRREKFEQDKGTFGGSYSDPLRGRGVQFPFAVADRVIIKGNKRTPQRFVGREAVVTTQCLNGWYVVKTLDNAESVKLQYRSLAKVSDNASSKPTSTKAPNWL